MEIIIDFMFPSEKIHAKTKCRLNISKKQNFNILFVLWKSIELIPSFYWWTHKNEKEIVQYIANPPLLKGQRSFKGMVEARNYWKMVELWNI